MPFTSPGDLPDPGIEPTSLASPALAGRFSTTEPPAKLYGKYDPSPIGPINGTKASKFHCLRTSPMDSDHWKKKKKSYFGHFHFSLTGKSEIALRGHWNHQPQTISAFIFSQLLAVIHLSPQQWFNLQSSLSVGFPHFSSVHGWPARSLMRVQLLKNTIHSPVDF